MAVMTTYGPLIGGFRGLASERSWDRSVRRRSGPTTATQPFGRRAAPLRKEIPDLLDDSGPTTQQRKGPSSPAHGATGERPLRDSEVAFLLDFESPFLRSISKVQSPSDFVFRERAVYWDLVPARAAYGKLLYRQNSFFVNRIQDAGLGIHVSDFT